MCALIGTLYTLNQLEKAAINLESKIGRLRDSVKRAPPEAVNEVLEIIKLYEERLVQVNNGITSISSAGFSDTMGESLNKDSNSNYDDEAA